MVVRSATPKPLFLFDRCPLCLRDAFVGRHKPPSRRFLMQRDAAARSLLHHPTLSFAPRTQPPSRDHREGAYADDHGYDTKAPRP